MPKKVRFLEEVRVDVFEAIKRAYIRRGLIPKKHKKPVPQKTTVLIPANADVISNAEQETGPARLIDITQKGQDILFRANTVFPFTLFPDTVTLDREKLTIANRIFFRMAKIISIPIADILSVEADVGPFFGSVHITSRYFLTTARSVNFLWRKESIRLQRLLQGYIIAHEREVDCTSIATKDLIILLNDLGQGSTD